jgi:hypothetical protein
MRHFLAAQRSGRRSHSQPDVRFKDVIFSHSHNAVIRVYDAAGNVIETHEHAGEFKEW